jgi:hypothetical protein
VPFIPLNSAQNCGIKAKLSDWLEIEFWDLAAVERGTLGILVPAKVRGKYKFASSMNEYESRARI